MGRVLPGSLGLGLVAAGLTLLAGLVLGVPLPLLLLPLAPLLLLEVVLRLPLVLLSTESTSAPGTLRGHPGEPTGPRDGASWLRARPQGRSHPGITYLEGLAALVLQLGHLLGHPGGDVGDGHLDDVLQEQGEVLRGERGSS